MQLGSWATFMDLDTPREKTLRHFGNSVVIRLEQIGANSGTCCIQTLLMLVAAGSLTINKDLEQSDEATQIRKSRQFIVDRLEHFEAMALQIGNAKVAIREIFRMVDRGEHAFWVDVLHRLQLETVIGVMGSFAAGCRRGKALTGPSGWREW